jgi:GNAT superfamily N-acetyltransferase
VIRPLQPADIPACAALLARLPQWFGIEASNRAYIASLDALPAFVADDDGAVVGFAAVAVHFPTSAEIAVMAVDPERHRSGIGRALVDAVEAFCRGEGVGWLHVKTRGPSTYDDDYERTRRFYVAMGFTPLYESHTEWGPENAALVLIKPLW